MAAQKMAITNPVITEMVDWYNVLRNMPQIPHDELMDMERRNQEEFDEIEEERHQELISQQS